jgi:Mrp family chromosome partitioning ATPase
MSSLNRKRSDGEPGVPNVIAITGGKGGVGKTSLSVNLAITLARLRHRVCLLCCSGSTRRIRWNTY